MGSDNLFNKRRKERMKRKENIEKQKSSTWLLVCEGLQTEPNYFKGAVASINKEIEDKYKLKVKIVGKGMNTIINKIRLIKTSTEKCYPYSCQTR